MSIIDELKSELQSHANKEASEGAKRFFKEEIQTLGVKSAIVKKISARFFKRTKGMKNAEIINLCEDLMKTGILEYLGIAQDWFFRLRKQYAPEDFKTLERWVKNYIHNWAACDDLCTHSLGYFLSDFPDFTRNLFAWAQSSNRWERRASAVALIYPVRKGKYRDKVFEIADILLTDKDDMVQKGYGWMLKVAADFELQKVFDYVMKNKHIMPRTALRYAIEKMPAEMKKKAMER